MTNKIVPYLQVSAEEMRKRWAALMAG